MVEAAKRAYVYDVLPRETISGTTGRQVLDAIVDGRLPQAPISQVLNFWLTEVGDGVAVFEGEPAAHLLNPVGIVHGGWALTLMDSAGACAAHSLLPSGIGYATLETKGNFSRPIAPQTGLVRAEARVVSGGRQIISAEVHVFGPDRKVMAHGTTTVLVLGGAK
jgi:uncharacterized protein (TIGR00369 family)